MTFHLFFNNDHHTREATDNDHDNVTQRQPRHHTKSNNPHHRKSDHRQGLQVNTAPTPTTHKRRPPTTQNGRMPANDTNRPPSRPTNNDRRLQRLTTTPPPPRSIDNGHHYPQATKFAHPHQLRMANPQATTDRPPATQASPPVTRSTHPSHPRTTTGVHNRRQPRPHSIENSHHRLLATNTAHQQPRGRMDDVAE